MIEVKCNMTGKKELKVNAVGNFTDLVVEFGTLAAAVINGVELNTAKGPADSFKEIMRDSKFWDVVINGCDKPADHVEELHEIAIQHIIQHMMKALAGDAETMGLSDSGLEALIRTLDRVVGSAGSDEPKKEESKEEPKDDKEKLTEDALKELSDSLDSIIKHMKDLGL